MNLYFKIDADGNNLLPPNDTEHLAVRVENALLAKPVIWTAHRSEKCLTWKQAKAWAEKLDINGWSWRLPTVEEALMLCDRSRAECPAVPVEYFPDCEGEWIWTGTKDAQSPSGCAWGVDLSSGVAGRGFQGGDDRVRAVRAGQY